MAELPPLLLPPMLLLLLLLLLLPPLLLTRCCYRYWHRFHAYAYNTTFTRHIPLSLLILNAFSHVALSSRYPSCYDDGTGAFFCRCLLLLLLLLPLLLLVLLLVAALFLFLFLILTFSFFYCSCYFLPRYSCCAAVVGACVTFSSFTTPAMACLGRGGRLWATQGSVVQAKVRHDRRAEGGQPHGIRVHGGRIQRHRHGTGLRHAR